MAEPAPTPIVFSREFVESLPPLRRRGSPIAHNVAVRPGLAMQRPRDLLEKYVSQMPAADRAKVIERLRSVNDEKFTTAKYEVLLYAFFRSRGHSVELNAPIGGRDADLLVGSAADRFFVEVATLFPAGDEGARLRLSERITQVLDAIDAPEFAGRIVFTDQPPPPYLDLRSVRREVEQLIGSYRAGRKRRPAVGFGWATVWIEPRTVETGGFLVEVGRPHESVALKGAQNALQRKVQHLRATLAMGVPLVVALCDAGFIRDFHASIEGILLGEPRYGVIRDADGEVGLQIARTGQAALFTTRAADPALSAVVSVDSRLFDEGVFLGLELWHHPSAAHPLPAGSFGEIVEHTATRVGEDVWEISPAHQNETELPVELGLTRSEA